MDDIIYRNFYWACDRIDIWWAMAWPYLKSDTAVHLYVIGALAIVTTATSLRGYCAKKNVTKLERKELAVLKVTFRGPDPQSGERIENRRKDLERRAVEKLDPFRSPLRVLLIAGLIVPTVVFLIVTLNYSWFDPVGAPFLSLADKIPLQTVDSKTLAYFAANQFGHGTLFDTLDVFGVDIVEITNNPRNYWFSGVVLLYRSLISAFAVALAFGWAQFFCLKRAFKKQIGEEMKRLEDNAVAHAA